MRDRWRMKRQNVKKETVSRMESSSMMFFVISRNRSLETIAKASNSIHKNVRRSWEVRGLRMKFIESSGPPGRNGNERGDSETSALSSLREEQISRALPLLVVKSCDDHNKPVYNIVRVLDSSQDCRPEVIRLIFTSGDGTSASRFHIV